MHLEVKIDVQRVLTAMLKAPEAFTKEVRVEMKREMTAIQEDARLHHRFTTRSGNLDRSVSTRVTRSGFSGKTFLNDRLAKYGKFIHNGTRKLKPDKFLYEAFDRRKSELVENINRSIQRGFKKAGL